MLYTKYKANIRICRALLISRPSLQAYIPEHYIFIVQMLCVIDLTTSILISNIESIILAICINNFII